MKLLILLVLGIVAIYAEESEVLKEFSAGNHVFAANVYKNLLQTNHGSFLACPLSAEIILALAHNGAGGKTAQELAYGLKLPDTNEKIQEAIQNLSPLLEDTDKYILNSANKIYVKTGYRIQNQFKDTAVNVFKSDIQNINFKNNVEAAAEINGWVEKKTHNKIKGLIDRNDLDEYTRAVLVNVMYFHGKWINEFPSRATRQRNFYSPNREVPVTMMQQVNYLKYFGSDELRAQFLELPYEGDDITMTIVLPNEKEGLVALEDRIADVLAEDKLKPQLVEVSLPKFTIKSTIEYVPILKELGIEEAFTDNAEFNGILIDQALKISKVIQKTAIEVEEEGTIASAATAVELPVPISANYQPPTVIKFVADHPFIYYIKIKDIVFFIGRYTGV